MPSPLALVWIVAPALVLAMGALLCLILGLFYVLYLQPHLDWLTRRGGGFLGGLIRWVSRPLTSRVQAFVARHIELLMRSFVTGIAPLVVALNQSAEVTQRLAGTIGDEAEQTWRAFWTLRHETVPRLITAALVPVREQLTRHTSRLDAVEDLNRRVAVAIGTTLRDLPWGAPGSYVGNFSQWLNSYEHLWAQVFGPLTTRVTELWNERVPELERAVAILRDRLDGLDIPGLSDLPGRVAVLQDEVFGRIPERFAALRDAIDTLAAEVAGDVGAGFAQVFERVAELERQVETLLVGATADLLGRIQAVEAAIQPLIDVGVADVLARLEAAEQQLRDLIGAATAALAERVAELERWRLEVATPALDVLTARVATLEGLISGGIELGLTALWERIGAIEAQLADLVMPQLEALRVGVIEIRERIDNDLLPRMASLEAILAPAALAALVLATMRVAAPNLFCRNVTRVTQDVCRMDEGFLSDLLGGLLVFAIALNPREIAAAGAALTGILGGVIAETVDH